MGELLTASLARASGTALTTVTDKNITSLTITRGDWDIYYSVNYAGTATATSYLAGWVSTTDATDPGANQNCLTRVAGTAVLPVNTIDTMLVGMPFRISLSSDTLYYLSVNATFSGGGNTCKGSGTIYARRVR